MKKTLFKIFTATLLLLGVILQMISCDGEDSFYMHDKSEIKSIEIVDAYYDENTKEAFQRTIVVIENKEAFLEELEEIKFKNSSNSDYGVSGKGIALKISYNNGDYEVFRYRERSEYSVENGYSLYCSKGVFDEFEFTELLLSFLSKEIQYDIESFNLDDYKTYVETSNIEATYGPVPDAKSAKNVAKEIWIEQGYKIIEKTYICYIISYDSQNTVWLVKSELDSSGFNVYALIDAESGKILASWDDAKK